MPTYVYKCDNDHTFEVVQSMSEDALNTCEICGAPARRQLFAPAVHFKGSGFYTTDYAKKKVVGGGNGSGGESSDSSKSDSKSSSGSETKSKPESSSSSSSGSSSSSSSSSKD